MNDENEWDKTLFNLILHAGNARCKAKEAAGYADEKEWDKAKNALEEANAEQVEAHKISANIVRDEANGKSVKFSVLLVHAMDLLMLAWSELDYTEQYVKLRQYLEKLEKR